MHMPHRGGHHPTGFGEYLRALGRPRWLHAEHGYRTARFAVAWTIYGLTKPATLPRQPEKARATHLHYVFDCTKEGPGYACRVPTILAPLVARILTWATGRQYDSWKTPAGL